MNWILLEVLYSSTAFLSVLAGPSGYGLPSLPDFDLSDEVSVRADLSTAESLASPNPAHVARKISGIHDDVSMLFEPVGGPAAIALGGEYGMNAQKKLLSSQRLLRARNLNRLTRATTVSENLNNNINSPVDSEDDSDTGVTRSEDTLTTDLSIDFGNAQFVPHDNDLIELSFTDYDCLQRTKDFEGRDRRGPSGIDFAEWLIRIEKAGPSEWIRASQSYVQKMDGLATEKWGQIAEECPLGVLTFLGVWFVQCLQQVRNEFEAYGVYDIDLKDLAAKESPEIKDKHATAMARERSCYDVFTAYKLPQKLFNYYPARILFGTRWPILSLLSVKNIQDTLLARTLWDDGSLSCLSVPRAQETANWRKLHAAFWKMEKTTCPETGKEHYKDISYGERKMRDDW